MAKRARTRTAASSGFCEESVLTHLNCPCCGLIVVAEGANKTMECPRCRVRTGGAWLIPMNPFTPSINGEPRGVIGRIIRRRQSESAHA